MKRKIVVTSIIFILLVLFSSCDLTPMEEGRSVNEYIFPYVKLELTKDENGNNCYSASILSGADVSTVYIPSYVDDFDGSVPIKYFSGFENDNDIVNLKSTTFESSSTEIKLKSLDEASLLYTLKYNTVDIDSTIWRNLPSLPDTEDEEFVGWFLQNNPDVRIDNGSVMVPGYTTLFPKWGTHTFKEVEAKEPTCTEGGWKAYHYCTNQGCDYTTKVEIPALEHNFVKHEEVPATCTEDGTVEYWECVNCKKKFSDSSCRNEISQITIPALGHALVKIDEVAATCTEKGVKEHYKCARCYSLFADEKAEEPTTKDELETPALGHEWVYKYGERIVDGHWQQCSRPNCKATTDVTSHDYSIKEGITAPTHNTPGEMKYTCSLCGATKTEDIPPLGDEHKGEAVKVLEPTCEESGYTVYKCTVPGCGVEYKGNYVDPKGHKTIKVEAKNSTCTEKGNLLYYTCSVCGKLFNDENGKNETTLENVTLPALGHLFNENVYESDGNSHWQKCVREGCGHTTEKTLHNYNQETTTYQKETANCTERAKYFYTCVCGAKGTETFENGEPLGHSLTHYKEVPPTCGVEGKKEYWSCLRCKYSFYDEKCTEKVKEDSDLIISPTGNHTFGSYVSMGESGHMAQCSVCHKYYGDTISHTIKTYWDSDEEGHWHACTACGYQKDYAVHSYVDYGTDKVCSVCFHVKKGKEETADGGFDIKPGNEAPEGVLKVNGTSGSFTATFTLDAESKMTGVKWYLEGVEIDGVTGATSSTCSFNAPDKRTYHIMCVVFNGTLVNSFEQTILGGGST